MALYKYIDDDDDDDYYAVETPLRTATKQLHGVQMRNYVLYTGNVLNSHPIYKLKLK